MADAQHKLSRRALLGAACAAPVLSAVEGPVLGLSEGDFFGPERAAPWRDLSVTFGGTASPSSFPRRRESSGSLDRAGKRLDPRFRGDDGRRWTRTLARFRRAEATLAALEGHADEDAFGRAHDRFNAALRRLLAFPAPDLAALATKLEIADEAELADLTYAPPSLAALAQDARRLASRSS
ncbi:MAG: hypothetical protein QOI38_3079 [Sphingomonadales bacterium]|jgi:hypothetical protein|nr:hypothetical protein [Sphingomonadales bacterium]